ncbi:unnamed protein product [Cyprideis torosa]|uniref:Uncharacterized protein n=1 Tax=Cyprideis torosa TaxID=163714 RepID=A0A7R8ZN92_9CRUS|nr:unnamed protein product [Cyprideis torosa]CAG0887370.1 unnamed protein product [Cyprideis torosa]
MPKAPPVVPVFWERSTFGYHPQQRELNGSLSSGSQERSPIDSSWDDEDIVEDEIYLEIGSSVGDRGPDPYLNLEEQMNLPPWVAVGGQSYPSRPALIFSSATPAYHGMRDTWKRRATSDTLVKVIVVDVLQVAPIRKHLAGFGLYDVKPALSLTNGYPSPPRRAQQYVSGLSLAAEANRPQRTRSMLIPSSKGRDNFIPKEPVRMFRKRSRPRRLSRSSVEAGAAVEDIEDDVLSLYGSKANGLILDPWKSSLAVTSQGHLQVDYTWNWKALEDQIQLLRHEIKDGVEDNTLPRLRYSSSFR